MGADPGLALEHRHGHAVVAARQLTGDSEPDYPGADDDDVAFARRDVRGHHAIVGGRS